MWWSFHFHTVNDILTWRKTVRWSHWLRQLSGWYKLAKPETVFGYQFIQTEFETEFKLMIELQSVSRSTGIEFGFTRSGERSGSFLAVVLITKPVNYIQFKILDANLIIRIDCCPYQITFCMWLKSQKLPNQINCTLFIQNYLLYFCFVNFNVTDRHRKSINYKKKKKILLIWQWVLFHFSCNP